jgi:hypothetical protein
MISVHYRLLALTITRAYRYCQREKFIFSDKKEESMTNLAIVNRQAPTIAQTPVNFAWLEITPNCQSFLLGIERDKSAVAAGLT